MIVVQLSLMKNWDYLIDETGMNEFDDREHYRILNSKTKARMNSNCYEFTIEETAVMQAIFEEKF